jgi:hypothetical protein
MRLLRALTGEQPPPRALAVFLLQAFARSNHSIISQLCEHAWNDNWPTSVRMLGLAWRFGCEGGHPFVEARGGWL